MDFLQWRGVTKEFGPSRALDDFSLSVKEGEIIAILGPSGSGKSTLLRITAGLEQLSGGDVLLEDHDISSVPPHQRGFGLMFQDYCLFPHLTVEQNIAFGLRMRRIPARERKRRVSEMLHLVRLEGFGKRDVLSLSGGEQQRVALARSLAPSPRLLMLDEPLGALDPELRGALLQEMAEILRDVGVTVLYVTHDHEEAMTVASRIVLVDRGRLAQIGTAQQLIDAPANAFVASFLGLGCVVPADLVMEKSGAPSLAGGLLLIRSDALHGMPGPGLLQARARVLSVTIRPSGARVRIALIGEGDAQYPIEMGTRFGVEDARTRWMPGSEQSIWVDPARCLTVPR
jgi:ABC-type Fe3+/spermidine/putrescine transport system ATPase subunit